MKKAEQIAINNEVIKYFADAMNQAKEHPTKNRAKLDTCQAHTEETHDYIILVSYNTPVAVYNKLSGRLYDALRYVYGYTATSALHIAKFAKKCRAAEVDRYRYYPV